MVKADVIIVTYNAKEKLKRCLRNLRRYTHTFDYRLTIVNNNSTDGTPGYLKRYNGRINIINNKKNFGFSKGANIGIKNSSNKYIVLLDDDAEVTEGWLDGLYNQIKNRPKVGIIGCKVLFPDKRIFSANAFIANKRINVAGINEIDKGQRDYTRESDMVNGACWLMRRKLIGKVGYFDEGFFPSQYEDLDYCLRTRLAGYKIIYNGKVRIIHYHLFRNGGVNQNKENWGRFLRKWKNAIHKFPLKDSHPVDKYIADGLNYLKARRFRQGLVELKKAESFGKRFSEPFYTGIALMGLGEYKKSLQEFKKVLRVEPLNFPARHNRTFIYKKMGLVKEAKRESMKSLFLFSSYKSKYFRD